MSSHKNLHFFNKSGDSLNLNYNENTKLFEGDILFDENSTDTFKTYALYTLEKVPTFDFESIGNLGTNKFQLFNEFGFHFYGSKTNVSQQITNIEPVNNDPGFYSKWIYGEHFEVKFPVGSIIVFDSSLLEFTNSNQSFVVVSTKKNAIMIISTVDNSTFETTYYTSYKDINTYIGKFISSKDVIGVYNYINTNYENKISEWSEPNFYDKLYTGKKLNVINTDINDGIYTVGNTDITDIIHFEYSVNKYSLPTNSDIIMEVILGTDLPKLYDGGLEITSNGKVGISDYFHYPRILKSGQVFKVVGSSLNNNFLTVSDIYDFTSNNNIKYYNYQDQVTYNGQLYECILAYTHSHSSQDTMYITPNTDITHWSNPTYIKVNESTNLETLLYSQLYLTTERYYYSYGWTGSSAITLASIVDKYKTDLQLFNIDLYYEKDYLKADLIYPSKYASVNFYHTQVDTNNIIGSELRTFERLIETTEVLTNEFNYDYSERYKYNIVFTDIDEYGIKIIINKMVYEEEVSFVYSGLNIDMKRTIDKTLRNWLSRNYLELYKLGINVELQYTGSYTSLFYNSILILTEYPNIPIAINEVKVGITAYSYIEHSRVLFNDLGPSLTININNKDYIVQTATSSTSNATQSIIDIGITLKNWNDLYSNNLLEYGIISNVKNNLLLFDIKQTENRLNYTINTGKINLPGINDYVITNKMKGNDGVLIASNEVILSATASESFEEIGFATGMVFSINNTNYPYVNQEFSIEYLDPKVLNLSYQGPFWDVNNFICNLSPFVTIAFSLGFGQTACGFNPMDGTSGEFDIQAFSASEFNINFSPNTYTSYSYSGVSGMVDIKYIQLSNSVYVLGDTSIGVLDSYYGINITTIDLPGNTQSIKMEFNPINNYVYCLSKNSINIFDPTTNVLISTILLTSNAVDILVNMVNGDVYVSYDNDMKIDIFYYDSFTSIPIYDTAFSGKMVYNEYEGDIYITSNGNVLRIDGPSRNIRNIYTIGGSLSNIYYEPLNESIFVYSTLGVYRIDNGLVSITDLITSTFSDMIFNNLTGELNVSDESNSFTRLGLTGSIVDYTDVSNHGYLCLNPYDGSIYLSSTTNNIVVIDPLTNTFILNVQTAITTKLIYNPDRKSMWFIQPSTNGIIESVVTLNNIVTLNNVESNSVEDNQYGTLHSDYVPREDIWLKTRDYFRRPRENFNEETSVKYYWKWFSDNVPEFFLYDYSGTQLQLSDNIYKGSASYSYTGLSPLSPVVLNKMPNTDITKISLPEYQKTIFDKIEYTLSHVDDSVNISSAVEPLQLFIGFQSQSEGALRSILQLYKSESISFTINSNVRQSITMETLNIDSSVKRGQIKLNVDSVEVFTDKGLKVGQHIVIYVKDSSNIKDQYISHNNASMFIIREIYTRTLIVDFFDINNDILEKELTIINDYPKSGNTTYLDFSIKVVDKEIGRFFTYGQTEEEDIRFKIELGNVGKLIDTQDVFIFKQYDILEGGIDWTFLNKKRKEMMMMKHLIYPYIGSYKSVINAINFFGYNDLQLNEYYKNVDTTSSDFTKLFKVEIPDIFDNTVEGWTENDFIKHTMPNDKFEGTNLFNLTYFITDKDGTNVLTYSLDEVIIKLQGLKYWLKKNIIPLTHKILDITGRTYLSSGTQIQHRVNDIRIINISENMTPVSFKLNEAYLMPVNSGSTVYNCVLDLYSIIPGIGADKNTDILKTPPTPYNGVKLVSPDYFNIKIRTYKTFKEWVPFFTYSKGDRITYYDILYESVIDYNKVNSPRKYELVTSWVSSQSYVETNIVKYINDIYVLSATSSQSTISPLLDSNWKNITEWRPIGLDPVQTISEFRNGDNMLPFNFTIDSNLDPFIVIEVTSDNGYGCVYSDKKNYEIRGTKDLVTNNDVYDSIGPFVPIDILYKPESGIYYNVGLTIAGDLLDIPITTTSTTTLPPTTTSTTTLPPTTTSTTTLPPTTTTTTYSSGGGSMGNITTTTTTAPTYTLEGRITNDTGHTISGGTVFVYVNGNTMAVLTLGTLLNGMYKSFNTGYSTVMYGATFELKMYSTIGIVNTNYAYIGQGSGPYTDYFSGAGDSVNPAIATIVTTSGPQYNLMFSIR